MYNVVVVVVVVVEINFKIFTSHSNLTGPFLPKSDEDGHILEWDTGSRSTARGLLCTCATSETLVKIHS